MVPCDCKHRDFSNKITYRALMWDYHYNRYKISPAGFIIVGSLGLALALFIYLLQATSVNVFCSKSYENAGSCIIAEKKFLRDRTIKVNTDSIIDARVDTIKCKRTYCFYLVLEDENSNDIKVNTTTFNKQLLEKHEDNLLNYLNDDTAINFKFSLDNKKVSMLFSGVLGGIMFIFIAIGLLKFALTPKK